MNTSRCFVRAARGLSVFVIAVGGLTLACPDAEAAGPVSRPIRDTSSRTTSTSGKVLVAIPQHGGGYAYLHRATRTYAGRPVRCGIAHHDDLREAKLVLMRLPANRRYAAGYDLCATNRTSRPTLQTVRGSDRMNGQTHAAGGQATVAEVQPMSAGFTVIAAGPTRRADLPGAMQGDGWALLEANRFRDAADAFAEMTDATPADKAGHAIALAMTGQLDTAADRLAMVMNAGHADAVNARLSPRLKTQLANLAAMMHAERPDAAAALTAMMGTDASRNGA